MAGRATTTDAYPGEAQSDARSSPPNADDIRATCAEMPTLAHGFRIERPSERMYFQRRRSFPSTDVHWLVDAERRVNEMRACSRILRRGCPGRSRRDAGTRSSASPSRGPPPGADLSARADMQASALRRPTELRGPRATRGVPPPWQRTCLRQWTNRRALRGRIDTTGRTPSNGS